MLYITLFPVRTFELLPFDKKIPKMQNKKFSFFFLERFGKIRNTKKNRTRKYKVTDLQIKTKLKIKLNKIIIKINKIIKI